jgi:hypothetical protein
MRHFGGELRRLLSPEKAGGIKLNRHINYHWTAVEIWGERVSIKRAGTCQTCNVPERFLIARHAML